MAGPCVSELRDKSNTSNCWHCPSPRVPKGHTSWRGQRVRISWFRGSKRITRIEYDSDSEQEELEHEPTQGDDLSDIDVNFLAKTIRTQSERVIGLSMRALQSYSI